MDMKTKLKTFVATVAMGAITHLVTVQLGAFQQKHGLPSDPNAMGVQIAQKFLKVDSNLFNNKAVAAEKAARVPASVPATSSLSKLDKKLCSFKASYVAKDQEAIKKNYRSIQDMYFKDKKKTEKSVSTFVTGLEGYLASGKYNDKKIICPQ